MEESIKKFSEQLSYEPEIKNAENFQILNRFILVGMGGSHLAGGFMRALFPELSFLIHRDYGLPSLPEDELKESTIIVSSYSGNTEEVLDAFEKVREKKLNGIAISTGGELLKLAEKYSFPHIQIPQTHIQPRLAIGYGMRALLKILQKEKHLKQLAALAEILDPSAYEDKGKIIAKALVGKIPIIYASTHNEILAYNWKIKFNETGKIPAFYNVIPELNHNEMTGFDTHPATKDLSAQFYFILLKDTNDHPRIIKRLNALDILLRERGFPVETIEVSGRNFFEKVFSTLLTADWSALYLAYTYKVEPEEVPMVEEFKKRIAE